MNIRKLLFFASAVIFASVGFASAQSLPELAKAEKARRAKVRSSGGPAKLYTEENKSAAAEAAAAASGAQTAEGAAGATTPSVAAGATGGKKEKTPEELAAERQKEWSDKVQKAQDDIKDLEGSISTNERNLGSMINITPARADLANKIEADKKKLAELKQSLVNLEEERRKAGMPRPR